MRVLLSLVFLSLMPLMALSQPAPQPLLEVEFKETEATPGQPLTLRLTVLVPTWMPEPPVWPEFDSPNVKVALPERASTAVSRPIDGETWSGVSRRYQITPMVPGTITLPASTIKIAYANPPATDPIPAELPVEAITLTGTVPKGAEGMDPFLAAQNLTLTQTIEGDTTGLKSGDSFSITVVAKADGLAAMFLPALISPDVPQGLRAYPTTPVVEDTSNRGEVTGTRTEKVSYVIEASVDGTLPGVSMDWFNLGSKVIETATTEETAVQATAPPPPTPKKEINWPRLVIVTLGATLTLLVSAWAVRRLLPRYRAWRSARHARFLASAGFAWDQLQKALTARDLTATHTALSLWQSRQPRIPEEQAAKISQAFADIGRARFGTHPGQTEDPYWQSLSSLLHSTKQSVAAQKKRAALPALNPSPSPSS